MQGSQLAGGRSLRGTWTEVRLMADFARRSRLWYRERGVVAAALRGVRHVLSRRSPSWRAYRRWRKQGAGKRHVVTSTPGTLVSVICPVRDSDPRLLQALYDSLCRQKASWELCLAEDRSKSPRTREFLTDLARRDGRVRFRAGNDAGGISATTNLAAETAHGDVLVFVDHDDELPSDSLGRVGAAFERDPSLDFAYTDEDQITEWGLRLSPTFKPGRGDFLSLGFNYIGHLAAIRRPLFDALGGLRSEYDGSQDHDLALRAFERARRVRHLPGIGYHWRRVQGSVAASSTAKSWAFERGRLAVVDACRRRGLSATVTHCDPSGVYRVEPDLGETKRRCHAVLKGGRRSIARWRAFLSSAQSPLELVGCTENRWPTDDADVDLLVVDAWLDPRPDDLAQIMRWAGIPEVGAVGASPVSAGRRRDLGYSIDRTGQAEPILPGFPTVGIAPGLIGSAVREVAAIRGGLLWVRRPPSWLLADLGGRRVNAAGELCLSMAHARAGWATLFVPHSHPRARWTRPARPDWSVAKLGSTSLWSRLRAEFPEEFWEGETDRFCARHALLTPLGIPAPADSTTHFDATAALRLSAPTA